MKRAPLETALESWAPSINTIIIIIIIIIILLLYTIITIIYPYYYYYYYYISQNLSSNFLSVWIIFRYFYFCINFLMLFITVISSFLDSQFTTILFRTQEECT